MGAVFRGGRPWALPGLGNCASRVPWPPAVEKTEWGEGREGTGGPGEGDSGLTHLGNEMWADLEPAYKLV